MAKIWTSIERKRIEFDDDIVMVYNDENELLYKGFEDYEPHKDANWKWDPQSQSYECVTDGKLYRKICLDI